MLYCFDQRCLRLPYQLPPSISPLIPLSPLHSIFHSQLVELTCYFICLIPLIKSPCLLPSQQMDIGGGCHAPHTLPQPLAHSMLTL